MTVAQHDVIDFIVHDPTCDCARLVMVEPRPWGDHGGLLTDLQEKLNTYLHYVTSGQLAVHYPELSGKSVRFELRAFFEPGDREKEFIRIAAEQHLTPARIEFWWRLSGTETDPSGRAR